MNSINRSPFSVDIENIFENLSEISEKQEKLNKLRISQAYEILTRIKTALPLSGGAVEAINTAANHFKEAGCLGRFSTKDKVQICRRLSELISEAGYDSGELIFPASSPSTTSLIAYVDNQYSASAYKMFTSRNSCVEPRIYNSFTEMCDDTASGVNDACIIPIENTSDGKLLSFYSLIDRADLKISTICDVSSEDESRRTRYALLRRFMMCPTDNKGDVYFEFSFCPTVGLTVDEMLHAAVLSGLVVYRIDSLPLKYNESNFIFHPVLLGNIENILIFTIFLTLGSAQYTPVGVCNFIT